MVPRQLLDNIQKVITAAYQFKDDMSKETFELIEKMGEDLSVDPTVEEPRQAVTLLNDLQEYLKSLEKLQKKSQKRIDNPDPNPYFFYVPLPLSTPEKKLLPLQITRNHEIRVKLGEKIKTCLEEYAVALNIKIKEKHLTTPKKLLKAIKKAIRKSFSVVDLDDNKKYLLRFDDGEVLDKSQGADNFTHATKKISKLLFNQKFSDKHKAVWYAKYCPNRTLAAREVVGQEFVRFRMPYQPKTRIAFAKNGDTYVISKEIPVSLSVLEYSKKFIRESLDSGKLQGLGRIQVVIVLVNEVDAKLGNMLIEKVDNSPLMRLIKIDGDWCFAALRDTHYRGKLVTTAKDIAAWPDVEEYKAYNWFDIYKEENRNPNYNNPSATHYLSADLKDNAGYRQEIHEELLETAITSRDFLEKFVKCYIKDPTEIALQTHTLAENHLHQRNAALQNSAFIKYLFSKEAREFVEERCTEIVKFTTISKNLLVPKAEASQLKENFINAFNALREEVRKTLVKVPPPVPPLPAVLPKVVIASLQARGVIPPPVPPPPTRRGVQQAPPVPPPPPVRAPEHKAGEDKLHFFKPQQGKGSPSASKHPSGGVTPKRK